MNKNNLNESGVIRFIGQVVDKEGTWYGIELELPKGKHNGTSNGVTYFTCEDNHGVLLRAESLKPR